MFLRQPSRFEQKKLLPVKTNKALPCSGVDTGGDFRDSFFRFIANFMILTQSCEKENVQAIGQTKNSPLGN
jgi:hypothetical protein